DPVEHEAYAHSLRRAVELDARLDEEVANSRLGIVTHYDGIVRAWDRLRINAQTLDPPPRYVEAEDRALLLEDVGRYREALEQKRDLVERFKTEQAVLRNSLRALPHNGARVAASLRARDGGEPMAARVDALVAATMRRLLIPTDALEREARARLADVASITLPDATDLERDVGLVVRHARVVLDRYAEVARIVQTIMTLHVSATAGRTLNRYRAVHERAGRRVSLWTAIAIASGVGALAFGAAFIIARLRRERDREAELARLKSRFVSMTSHEFRTPLSVILSSAELLEAYAERWDEAKRRTHIDRIRNAAHLMTRMVEQVLLIGRAEAGVLEARPGAVDLGGLVRAVADEVRTTVGPERVLELDLDAPEREVVMDERLVRQVLTNLLSNAFKYSSDDGVVRLSLRAGAEEATFEIEDEGIGISVEDRARLFEAFHRGSNAETIPGTGLGLAVVKKSIEVHGGSITVDSEPGRGTRFSVRVRYLGGDS
ncbi:MAG: DAHL domain-containing protein, partial [Sandaracinaceae bacterium]